MHQYLVTIHVFSSSLHSTAWVPISSGKASYLPFCKLSANIFWCSAGNCMYIEVSRFSNAWTSSASGTRDRCAAHPYEEWTLNFELSPYECDWEKTAMEVVCTVACIVSVQKQFHLFSTVLCVVLSGPQTLAAMLCGEVPGDHSDAWLCPWPLHSPQLSSTATGVQVNT